MTRILVLGAGRVGGLIARDLAAEHGFDVTVADRSEAALSRLASGGIEARRTDLSDAPTLAELVRAHELVVGAVPGFLGFAILRQVIEAGRPIVDISFFDEDPFELDDLARERGVTAVVDCGLAPGLPNLLAGRAAAELDRLDRFACYVGGLPLERTLPYEYKAPFSPIDVIEEYTRPARVRRGGREVTVPALSGLELLDVPGLGTLEAFLTDGLRTLLRTLDCPEMQEKTLRYPGHAERMKLLRDSGFFDKQPMALDGGEIRPLDLTARLLFPLWELGEAEADVVVLRVEIDGGRDGESVRRSWELTDRRDTASGATAMARTTGYPCTAAVRLLAAGLYDAPGITPPEMLGRDEQCFGFLLERLAERGIVLRFEEA